MNRKFLTFLRFAGLCVVLGALSASARAQAQGSWTMKAPIPLARNEVALAAVGEKVHVIGGGIKGVAGPYHDEYDPATDRWTTLAPMPSAEAASSAAGDYIDIDEIVEAELVESEEEEGED